MHTNELQYFMLIIDFSPKLRNFVSKLLIPNASLNIYLFILSVEFAYDQYLCQNNTFGGSSITEKENTFGRIQGDNFGRSSNSTDIIKIKQTVPR